MQKRCSLYPFPWVTVVTALEAISFHCLPPQGGCVIARVKLQLDFGQNFPGKYFPAVFFWANTDMISRWTLIFQNITVHLGTDSAWLGAEFWGWVWLFLGCLQSEGVNEYASFWALNSCMNIVLSVLC